MPTTEKTTRDRPWRQALALLAVLLVGVPAVGAENEDQPTQEAYRDWPSDEVIERAYWLPWNADAFRRAALFDRPILLLLDVNWSASGSRFEAEALSDPAVLRAINSGFVSVRVNADLRPDVRERYQTGSWPVVTFLLPNGKPMLGQIGQPGGDKPITTSNVPPETLLFLVREGAKYWDLRRAPLLAAGDRWTQTEGPPRPLRGAVDAASSDAMAQWLGANADRLEGGFGISPKFVVSGLFEYAALRQERGEAGLIDHARATLHSIIESPLYDSSAGGVRRIATAASYGGVRPEKLLVTNTALLRDLLFALRDKDDPELAVALRKTVDFVTQRLARDRGGFYLAQAARADEQEGAAPELDRLVLSGPNALAGATLIRAGLWLGDADVVASGRGALDLVAEQGVDGDGVVTHALAPIRSTRLYLESQADVALGLLDGFETTGDVRYLRIARRIADLTLRRLGDTQTTALLDHAPDRASIGLLANSRYPLRPNVRVVRVLRRLQLHGGASTGDDMARDILGYFAGVLPNFKVHGVEAALALEEVLSPPLRIRFLGAASDPAMLEFRRAAANIGHAWTLLEWSARPGPRAQVELILGDQRRTVAEPGDLAFALIDLLGQETR